MRWALLLAMLVGAFGAAAAAGNAGDAGDAIERPRPDGVRRCSERVEAAPRRPRPGPDDVRVGPVRFYGLRLAEDPDMWGRPLRRSDRSWKAAIEVRAGRPVVLAVDGGRAAGVALDYVRSDWQRRRRRVAKGNGQEAVRIKPCRPRTRRFSDGLRVGRYTQFNGGFLVHDFACVTIRAFRGSRSWKRQVGLGTTC